MMRSDLLIRRSRNSIDLTAGLVWHHPLSENLATLPTGQSVSKSGTWTFATVSGVPCATKANGNASIKDTAGTGVPVENAPRTMSLWVLRKNSNAINIAGYGATSVAGGWRFRQTSSGKISSPPFDVVLYSPTADSWHHYAATLDSGGTVNRYVDGVFASTNTYEGLSTASVSSTNPVFIGWSSWEYGFSVADVRIYDRVLREQEIAALAALLTPTA